METVDGHHCPDGHPHHWSVSEPEYGVDNTGQYVEFTRLTCLNCGHQRDNLCPLVPEVWTDELTMGSVVLGIEKR